MALRGNPPSPKPEFGDGVRNSGRGTCPLLGTNDREGLALEELEAMFLLYPPKLPMKALELRFLSYLP